MLCEARKMGSDRITLTCEALSPLPTFIVSQIGNKDQINTINTLNYKMAAIRINMTFRSQIKCCNLPILDYLPIGNDSNYGLWTFIKLVKKV